MDEDKKELELEPKETEATADELEFDPTESEEFYDNLEAAINAVEEPQPTVVPELVLADTLKDEAEIKNDSMEDDLFAGVDAALSEQIEQEFGKEIELSPTVEKEPGKVASVWKAIPTWTKVLVGCILAILISVGLLFGTEGGRNLVYKVVVGILFDDIKEDPDDLGNISPSPELTVTVAPDPTEEPVQNPDTTPEPTGEPDQNPDTTPEPTEDPAVTPEPTPTPKPAIHIMDDEDVINVLLLGEENIYGSKRGRTDAIIVVSIDLNGGPLKMVSFQRDLYVQIPGYPDDRLNAAYAYGGAKLIMETIEKNFGIDIDSYVKVDFDGFENIIDQLGGLRISLTAVESEYLNTTKYISKPEERNTVAGYQNMTGAQVLGYCRVRYKPTAEGLKDDRGRNYRHRVVLQALFDKYKEKSFAELATIMRQCFDYVSVASNLEDIAVDCLQAVVENKMFEIETMQMPKSGLYSDTTIAGKDVIVAYPENVTKLQEFLYREE